MDGARVAAVQRRRALEIAAAGAAAVAARGSPGGSPGGSFGDSPGGSQCDAPCGIPGSGVVSERGAPSAPPAPQRGGGPTTVVARAWGSPSRRGHGGSEAAGLAARSASPTPKERPAVASRGCGRTSTAGPTCGGAARSGAAAVPRERRGGGGAARGAVVARPRAERQTTSPQSGNGQASNEELLGKFKELHVQMQQMQEDNERQRSEKEVLRQENEALQLRLHALSRLSSEGATAREQAPPGFVEVDTSSKKLLAGCADLRAAGSPSPAVASRLVTASQASGRGLASCASCGSGSLSVAVAAGQASCGGCGSAGSLCVADAAGGAPQQRRVGAVPAHFIVPRLSLAGACAGAVSSAGSLGVGVRSHSVDAPPGPQAWAASTDAPGGRRHAAPSLSPERRLLPQRPAASAAAPSGPASSTRRTSPALGVRAACGATGACGLAVARRSGIIGGVRPGCVGGACDSGDCAGGACGGGTSGGCGACSGGSPPGPIVRAVAMPSAGSLYPCAPCVVPPRPLRR